MTLITLTDAAVQRVKVLLASRGKESVGIRIGVRSRGCSGLSYTLEYADTHEPGDEKVEHDGVTVIIDSKALLFLLGMEIDFIESPMESGFVFRNPNEKGTCGCGKSFHV